MNIYAIIKKYTLSEFADSTYWGKFNLLTGLPLSHEQFLKLINFYSTIDSYRNQVVNTLSFADGHGYKFISDPGSLTAYSYFAVIDPTFTLPIIKSGEDYNNFVIARDILFEELGWSSYEERVAVVETTFNKDTVQFSNMPNTYEEISQLYETSQSLETFLGN